MHTGISAVQHLRPLRGGAHSHLLRASDGACYVTKFQNNPQHVRVLANEMLATNLGLALGLSGCERSLVGRPFIHVEVNASQFLALQASGPVQCQPQKYSVSLRLNSSATGDGR